MLAAELSFSLGGFEADGLSALVLVIVSWFAALAALFAGGYMRDMRHEQESRLWWFYCNYNLFALRCWWCLL